MKKRLSPGTMKGGKNISRNDLRAISVENNWYELSQDRWEWFMCKEDIEATGA